MQKLESAYFGSGQNHRQNLVATVCSMMGNMDEIIYLTPEVLKEIQDAREHDDHCTALNYKIQPENQGKILWLTGPPGI